MPLYEYYCARCSTKFEMLRSMSESDAPARCPNGHANATRALSMFAAIGGAAEGGGMPSSGGGCGCGGGGCGCGH